MSTTTRGDRDPQAIDSRARLAQRQRHIRILRAVSLIARTKCGVAEAARSVGLTGRGEMQELLDLLDLKKIPRKRAWGHGVEGASHDGLLRGLRPAARSGRRQVTIF